MILYISFMKISQRVFELLHGHEIMTGGRTDRRTDGQGDYYRAPPTLSGGALKLRNRLQLAIFLSAYMSLITTVLSGFSQFSFFLNNNHNQILFLFY